MDDPLLRGPELDFGIAYRGEVIIDSYRQFQWHVIVGKIQIDFQQITPKLEMFHAIFSGQYL